MRRKISDVRELADELPDLTEQQMRFVEGILGGQKITESYKAAYDCSAMQQTTVWANASRLRHHSKITAWISAARIAGLGTATLSLDGHLSELARLREVAERTGNIGAAVQAEQLRGKAMGLYTEHLDVKVTDIADELREIAKISPELAKAYADEKGVTWN
jgi:hypothetical protein